MKLFTRHQAPTHKRPQDSFGHRILNDPYLDWLFMLIITLIAASACVTVGFMRYSMVQERLDEISVIVPKTPEQIFDSSTLQQVLNDFGHRATERDRIKKGYSDVSDPSL